MNGQSIISLKITYIYLADKEIFTNLGMRIEQELKKLSMIKNYFITAIRNMLRQKMFSIINLMGLAIGLACSITIILWVQNELSYDGFHDKSENIFLVQQTIKTGDNEYTTDRSGGAYAQALKEEFTEIISTTRFSNVGELLLNYQPVSKVEIHEQTSESNIKTMILEKKFLENRGMATDSTVFEIFSFHFLQGNPSTALTQPNSIVITEKISKKYFDSKDPIGEIIRINNKYDFTVTGIIKNVPENSSIQFDFLVPFDFLIELGHHIGWFTGNPYYTYVLLPDNNSWQNISRQLPDFFSGLFDPGTKTRQFLTPLKKVYLYGETKAIIGIILFSVLSLLILLIACINFMNLSTAKYITRTKEVAIRKVVGAGRHQLIKQFLGESLLMVFIALNIAIFLIDLFINELNTALQANLSLDLTNYKFLILLIGIILFTGIVAGSYPAFFISGFKPADIMKNAFKTGKKGVRFRKILVVIQYSFALLLMIITMIVYKQYNYVRNADLGITRDNIIYMPVRGELEEKYEVFKTRLRQNPDILHVTTCSKIPLFIDQGEFEWGETSDEKNSMARVAWVGYDFLETFDLKLTAGRFYSRNLSSSNNESMVINESMVKKLGWESPVGRSFYLWDDRYTVIGVVEDFFSFPVTMAGEAIMLPFSSIEDYLFIKIETGRETSVISYIEKVFSEINPIYPFIYYFFNDYVDPLYAISGPINKIVLFFTLLGILISCLGLFGLVTYSAEMRTKEIGIRKAMGSSVSRIILLLSKESTKLVFIAFLIAYPIAIILMQFMFKQLAYHTSVGMWIFIASGVLVFVIVILTIGYQTYKSSVQNPVVSLRYE
ncbi:MAG: ABC transporter permease [Bacteroidales bacterium]|nr:ABC transporter permease [Bacteroidales bacterium]